MDSRIGQVEQLLVEGKQFTSRTFCYPGEYPDKYGGEDTPEWHAWKTRVFNITKSIGSDDSPACQLAARAVSIKTKGYVLQQFERAHSSLLKALELALAAMKDDAFGELRQPKSQSASPTISNKVFVVHGHDNALKTDVEQFLHDIGLEPVVLHRKPDQGQTVIEKFEKHSDVGYAIILLTEDEVAYAVDQAALPADQRSTEMRARPNVIFEFGYFVGKLGRDRVCCLHKGAVALPSDLNGLVYKQVGSSLEPQAFALVRELKAAGYKVRI